MDRPSTVNGRVAWVKEGSFVLHSAMSLERSQKVQVALVAPLFDRVTSVMLAHALPMLMLGLVAWRSTEAWPVVLMLLSGVIWVARISVLLLAKRDQRLRGLQSLLDWKITYEVTGLAWAAALGAASFLTIVRVPDEALRIIAISLPLGTAGGISSRNAGTPRYALGLLGLVLLPVQVGSACLGGFYWLASLMQIGYSLSLISMLKRSHADTVKLLVAEHQNAHLAARLDVALGNMKQGLTLFDPSGVLEIVNRRFMDLFSLAPSEPLTGTSAADLLRRCRAALAEPDDTVAASASSLESLATAETSTGTLRLKNGNIISVQREPLPAGGWLTSYEDVTERRRIADEVEHMAYHDALTGLANRIKFNERLADCLALLDRGEWFAVLYLDLDKFKPVNDLYGHAVGDRLLVEVAGRMSASLRTTDLVARLGGDEFAVIISNPLGMEAISELAQRLLENVSRPYRLGEHEVVIGTSIGVALAPNDGADAATLLKAADQSLYNAKSQGRGRFCFSQVSVPDPVVALS